MAGPIRSSVTSRARSLGRKSSSSVTGQGQIFGDRRGICPSQVVRNGELLVVVVIRHQCIQRPMSPGWVFGHPSPVYPETCLLAGSSGIVVRQSQIVICRPSRGVDFNRPSSSSFYFRRHRRSFAYVRGHVVIRSIELQAQTKSMQS